MVSLPASCSCVFLISDAIVMKASSTLVAFFALVSRNRICSSSANIYKGGKEEKERDTWR